LKTNEQLYQIAFSLIKGVGPRRGSSLLASVGDPERIFKETPRVLSSLSGISPSFFGSLNLDESLSIARRELEFIQKNNIQTHFYSDENFPRRLRHCGDSPLMIYSKGNFNPNPERTVSVVGTRSSTLYGEKLVKELLEKLQHESIQIISGMAYGIDILAHQYALQFKMETIGVMGHSLDRIYPHSHRKVAIEMLRGGGLVSEFTSGTKPDRENFPMRNRIVAGMSDAIVVVESKATGGSLITAELGLDYSRDVFAFPGNVGAESSEGCNNLIKQNKAQLITSADEIMHWMGWNSKPTNKQIQIPENLGNDESEIYLLLQNEIMHVDVIGSKLKKSISELHPILFSLELKGLIRSLPGAKFSIQ
jgi:DNA processing protein